jgi:outer membrane biosynthesis protein TonB
MGHFQGMRRMMGGFMPPIANSDSFANERKRRDEREAEFARHVDRQFGRLLRKMERVMATLDDVLERVYQQRGQIDSLAALTKGIKAKLDEALGGALNPAQQAKVDALFVELDKNTAAISKAVRANDDDPANDDPVEPAPQPEPQPAPEPAPEPVAEEPKKDEKPAEEDKPADPIAEEAKG